MSCRGRLIAFSRGVNYYRLSTIHINFFPLLWNYSGKENYYQKTKLLGQKM